MDTRHLTSLLRKKGSLNGCLVPDIKRVKDAQNILKFSKRAIAKDIYKILSSAAANAENNHQLDLDILKVSEAYCGKGMVMKRWRARAKGRPGRIEKFLSNITIKVAETQNENEESK